MRVGDPSTPPPETKRVREGGDHLSSFGGQAQSHGSRTEATKGQSPKHHQGQSPEPKRTAQKIRGVAPRLWTPSARSSAVGASHKSGDEPKAQEAEIENQNRKNKTDKKTLPNSSCTGTNWRAGRCPPRGRSIARVRAVSFAARTGSDRDTF